MTAVCILFASGNRTLSRRNEYVYSVKVDVTILYILVKQVILVTGNSSIVLGVISLIRFR